MPFINSTLGCFDDTSVCLDTIFCPCCQIGRQCAAIDGRIDQHDCGMCLVALCCAPFMGCCLRHKVSEKYQLDEGILTTLCCGFFCSPCSICMTGRELNERNANPGGFCCKARNMSNYGSMK